MEKLKSQLLLACMLTLLLGGAHVALGVMNDNCNNAEPIGEVEDKDFETREATFDGSGHCLRSPNIWYCYTASCTGTAAVSLLGSGYDTALAVYDGCGCGPSLGDRIGCNDDFGNSMQSQISFPVLGGKQYLIEIGGYASDVGQGVLNVSCDGEPLPEPSKDDCATAQPIGDVNDMPFDTKSMTFDGRGLCMTSPNIWYCYTPTCTGSAHIALCGSSYDTKLAVYKGCICDPLGEELGCNDDACYDKALQSELIINVVAGEQYLIEVGGYSSSTGAGILNVSCQCGDLDADGDVDVFDYDLFLAAFGHDVFDPEYNVLADLDTDGIVSLADYQLWMQCYRDFIGSPMAPPPTHTVLGDLDEDGDVDLIDFIGFADCYSGSGGSVSGGCLAADLDGDGDVDLIDFTVFANNFGASN